MTDNPIWLTTEGLQTLQRGYLLQGEVPRDMYQRLAAAAAAHYPNDLSLEERFFDAMWKGWLCPASPVLSNLGAKRGLPISCYSVHVGDSVAEIFDKNTELAMLSKNGGGVGIYLGDVRGRGSAITALGASEGIIPWAKVYDTTTVVVSQGGVRRGATAIYLPIEHLDIDEFLQIRRPMGDINRRCMNTNQAVCISDQWMKDMLAGDVKKRLLWQEILRARVETGEPYIFFTDAVNEQSPECYKTRDLKVKTSNICCIAGDTLVVTKEFGPVQIRDLVNRTVTVWDGDAWVTNESFASYGNDSVFRVHLKDGSFVDANKKHRWFAASTYYDIAAGRYPEICTSELREGMWLESHSIPYPGTETTSGAYLKGFLLGDGTSVKNSRPQLAVYFTKYDCIPELLSSALEVKVDAGLFTNCIEGLSFREEVDTTGSQGTWGCQRRRSMQGLSARKMELYPWASSYKMGLPREVFKWSRATVMKFLSGLFDADGTVSKGWSLQFSSQHRSFIDDLQLLIKTLGYSSGVDQCRAETEFRSDCWRLTVSSYDAYEMAKELTCRRLTFRGTRPNRKSTGWRKIIKIEELPEPVEVFCPKIPSTGKFALANGLMTGNTEITLYTDPEHTFVCCLSSLNLAKWDEWKETDTVQLAILFLDAVMEDFLVQTEGKYGFEAAHRFARKGRPLGLGVLGWHTALQERGLPFDSFGAMQLNAQIFKHIREEADLATAKLATEKGEPEWCTGSGRRNTHTIAIAPTVSNSAISGGVSAGIEPIAANVFAVKSAKGTFMRTNQTLKAILAGMGKDAPEVWATINAAAGSVQGLSFLSDEQKSVFLTARELNQHAVIRQAAQRQKWVDQGQSLNLFFPVNADPKYIHQVHIEAWEQRLKTLYYLRSEGVLRGDSIYRDTNECSACDG